MTRPLRAPGSFTLYHLLWSGLDLLLPPECGGCGTLGSRWCQECAAKVQRPRPPLCITCGMPVSMEHDICADCRRERPAYSALRSWAVFDAPVRNAIHRLKYRRDIGLGEALAIPLAEFLDGLGWAVEVAVPVPLGRKRQAQRGYNQASLIARPLSMAMRMAYAPDALARNQETRSQVGLTRPQREENVRGAFRGKQERIRGRSVLLVDDVATTGSTLSSCAEALCAAGARDVFALTVCRAMPRHGLHIA